MCSYGLLGPLMEVNSEFWKGNLLRICHTPFHGSEFKRIFRYVSITVNFVGVNLKQSSLHISLASVCEGELKISWTRHFRCVFHTSHSLEVNEVLLGSRGLIEYLEKFLSGSRVKKFRA